MSCNYFINCSSRRDEANKRKSQEDPLCDNIFPMPFRIFIRSRI